MLATQLLLAQGEWGSGGSACSPRKVLRAIRGELRGVAEPRSRFCSRLAEAAREQRPGRTSAKACREWPRRKEHVPPKPPSVLTLTDQQKALISLQKRQTA